MYQILASLVATIHFSLQGLSNLAPRGEWCVQPHIMHHVHASCCSIMFKILHCLHHIQFVKEYLEQYKVLSRVKISDDTLKELFGSVVKR